MKRLEILKTYKIFINGEFPRSESGRYFTLINQDKKQIANICLSSRKDFRNAVVSARGAFKNWSDKSAFNRGQIIYRIAEMMEGRKSQFIEELIFLGFTKNNATKEVLNAIDKIVYVAGWSDKFQQIIGTVNPVSSSHYNFSIPEPMGVISLISSNDSPFSFLNPMLSAIVGGNTVVVLAPESFPTTSISFSEVLSTSDLSKGVVNILTGKRSELFEHFSSHMDVNAIISSENKFLNEIKSLASNNVKRVIVDNNLTIFDLISSTQEIKTTWHPIGF